MTGLFARLAERALGLAPLLAPRLPTRYESDRAEPAEERAPTAASPWAVTGAAAWRSAPPAALPATPPAPAAAIHGGRRSSRQPAPTREGTPPDLPPAASLVDGGHPLAGMDRRSMRAAPPLSRPPAAHGTASGAWPGTAEAAPAGGAAFAEPVGAAAALPSVARSVAAAGTAPAAAAISVPGGSAMPGAEAAPFPEPPAPPPGRATETDAARPDAGPPVAGRDLAQPHRPAPVAAAQDRSLPTPEGAAPAAPAGPVEIAIGRVEIRFAAPAAPRPAAPGAVHGPPSLEALLARDRR